MARDKIMVKRSVANGFQLDYKECVMDKKEQEECDKNDEESKKTSMPIKTYSFRNSTLTDMMSVNHLQTVHNITIAVFVLMIFNAMLYYMAAPNKFFEDLSTISWAAGGFKTAFIIWTGLHFSCLFILHPAISYWARARKRINKKPVDCCFLVMWIAFLIFIFVIPAHLMVMNRIPPITGFAILGEQLRIFMKMYSFVRENAGKVIDYTPENGNDNPQIGIPTIRKFVYFLFAPCLIYRDSYPRTKSIRWGFVFSHLSQMLACVFIFYCVFCRFFVDIFRKVGIERIAPSQMALIFAGCMVFGSLGMFLIFYLVLHCWLNAFAEMLRFGDRMFYQDWWNSTTFSQYYRKWNGVVYDWLYTYIYSDVYKISGNKSASLVSVFIISALVHEYVITITLGFFYPALFFIYSTVGVSLVFITKQRTSQGWNIFMWLLLISGWGLLALSYGMEWYARINCPKVLDDTMDYFIPRSWFCNITGNFQ